MLADSDYHSRFADEPLPDSKQTSLEKELNKPSGEAQRTKLQEQLTKLCDKRVRQTLEHKVRLCIPFLKSVRVADARLHV